YLVIYFTGTVVGFWASMIFSPRSLSVGASAGLCGLVGAMIAVGFLSRSSMALDIRAGYVRYAVMLLAMGFFIGRIDNAAHLGGMVGGFAIAYLMGLPTPVIPPKERIFTLAAWVCVLLTVYSFAQMFLFYQRMHEAPSLVPQPSVTRPAPKQTL